MSESRNFKRKFAPTENLHFIIHAKAVLAKEDYFITKHIEFPAVIQSPSKLQSKQPCNVNHVSIVVNKRAFYLLASRAKKAVNIVAWSAKSAKIPVIGKNIQWRIIWFCCSCKKQKQTKTTTKTKQGKKKTLQQKQKRQDTENPTYQSQQKDRKISRLVKSGRKIIKTISSFASMSD